MKKNLAVSEWVISGSLVLILASLLLISHFHEHRKKVQLAALTAEINEPPIDVTISGEVISPGTFSVAPGTRLGDLVKRCRPKRYADLSGLDLDCPVKIASKIVIPQLASIKIKIEGAAKPLELTLPVGSRISDLKSKIQCEADADLRFFKRRRLLKNEEVVSIPRILSSASAQKTQELD